MGTANFFQGLLGGLASGVVENATTQRKQSFLQEMENMKIAASLLQSGNYEAFSLLDPKLRKSIGFGDDNPALQALVGYGKKSREMAQQKEELQLGTAKNQQQITGLQLGREQEESAIPYAERPANVRAAAEAGSAADKLRLSRENEARIAALPPEQQVIERFPNIANYDLTVKKYEEAATQREEDRKERQRQFDLTQKRLELDSKERERQFDERMAEIKSSGEDSRAIRKAQTEAKAQYDKDKLEADKERQQLISDARDEKVKNEKLKTANRELDNAAKALKAIKDSAPKESKIGKNSHPAFNTAQDAKDFIISANAAQKRLEKANARVAEIDGGEPEPGIVWKYFDGTAIFGRIGSHLAVPEYANPQGSETTEALKSDDKIGAELNRIKGNQPQSGVTSNKITTTTTEPSGRTTTTPAQQSNRKLTRDNTREASEAFADYNQQVRERGKSDQMLEPEEFIVFRELQSQGMSTINAVSTILRARKETTKVSTKGRR